MLIKLSHKELIRQPSRKLLTGCIHRMKITATCLAMAGTIGISLSPAARARASAENGAGYHQLQDALPAPQQYPKGTPRYRGVNLSGSEFGNKFYAGLVPKIPDDMVSLAVAGSNVARFPIKWEFVQPKVLDTLDSTYVSAILPPVTALLSSGYSVLLDLHSYMRHCSPSTGNCTIASSDQLADVWNRLLDPSVFGSLAQKHGGDGTETGAQLMLDLMNEPHSMPTEQVLQNLNAAIGAVRKRGLKNLVLLEGNGWTGMHSWTQAQGPGNPSNAQVFTRQSIQDPADHYAINVHQYLDSDSSGSHVQCVPMGELPGKLNFEPFRAWMQAQRMRVFLSEFGGAYNQGCIEGERYLLGLVTNASSAGGPQDSGFIGWTAWAAGHAWGGGYIYGLNPGDQAQAMVVEGLGPFLQSPTCRAPGFIASFNGTPPGIDTGYSVQLHNPDWSDKFSLPGGKPGSPPPLACVNATRVTRGDTMVALYDEQGKQTVCKQELSATQPVLDMGSCGDAV